MTSFDCIVGFWRSTGATGARRWRSTWRRRGGARTYIRICLIINIIFCTAFFFFVSLHFITWLHCRILTISRSKRSKKMKKKKKKKSKNMYSNRFYSQYYIWPAFFFLCFSSFHHMTSFDCIVGFRRSTGARGARRWRSAWRRGRGARTYIRICLIINIIFWTAFIFLCFSSFHHMTSFDCVLGFRRSTGARGARRWRRWRRGRGWLLCMPWLYLFLLLSLFLLFWCTFCFLFFFFSFFSNFFCRRSKGPRSLPSVKIRSVKIKSVENFERVDSRRIKSFECVDRSSVYSRSVYSRSEYNNNNKTNHLSKYQRN